MGFRVPYCDTSSSQNSVSLFSQLSAAAEILTDENLRQNSRPPHLAVSLSLISFLSLSLLISLDSAWLRRPLELVRDNEKI